jgi:hypothetical protein
MKLKRRKKKMYPEIRLCAWCIYQKINEKRRKIKCSKGFWTMKFEKINKEWNTVQDFAMTCKDYQKREDK